MAVAIVYCDRCARMVPREDVTSGAALDVGAGVLCAGCAAGVPRTRRAEARRKRAAAASVERGRRTDTDTVPRVATGRGRPVALIGGTTAGLFVGIAIVAVILSPEPEPQVDPVAALPPVVSLPPAPRVEARPVARPQESSTAEVAHVPAASPRLPKVSEARLRLAEIGAMRDDALMRYREMRSALQYFAIDFPGTPEAAEAATALRELDAAYARAADEALAATRRTALALAREGDMERARSELASLKTRFADGPWLGARGQKAIDEILDEIERARAEAVETRIAALDNLLPEGRFRGKLTGWTGHNDQHWHTPKFKFREEDGRKFVRVTEYALVHVMRAIPAGVKRLRLSFEIRNTDIVPGEKPWEVPSCSLHFHDASGEEVSNWRNCNWIKDDCDWRRVTRDYDVPSGATQLRVSMNYKAKGGTADFADVSVTRIGW